MRTTPNEEANLLEFRGAGKAQGRIGRADDMSGGIGHDEMDGTEMSQNGEVREKPGGRRAARTGPRRDTPDTAEVTLGRRLLRGRVSLDVFDLFPHGILVADQDGRAIAVNEALVRLMGDRVKQPTRCCELFGCGEPDTPLAGRCLTQLALAAGEPLPEVRVDLPPDSPSPAVWVTAAPIARRVGRVIFEARRGDARDRRRRTQPHWMAEPRLRLVTLGRTRVESREGPIGGHWLAHRPGQLLKFLACERHRVVSTDEIAETLWPGMGRKAPNNVRHTVHALRDRLEPEREKRAPSSFVVAIRNGYSLNLDRIEVDAHVFEQEVKAGIAAWLQGEPEVAEQRLESGLGLYGGDLLADEPYAEWAFAERNRLRELMVRGLRTLARIAEQAGDLELASERLQRLADVEPLDAEIQRDLIALLLRRQRFSDASRRYEMFRIRMQRAFGMVPDFDLADLRDSMG